MRRIGNLPLTPAERTAKAQKKRRESWLTAFTHGLKDGGCADCYCVYPRSVMEFDHVLPKVYNPSRDYGMRSPRSVLGEVAKCHVVCANCHKLRTGQRRRPVPIVEGS